MTSSPYNHNGGPPFDAADDLDNTEPATNWFAVSRDVFSHPVVGIHNRPFTEFEAWLWLISRAAYAPRRENNKGVTIVIDPGHLMAAHAFLEREWMWTVARVRHFLKRLETEAMITRYTNTLPANRNNQIQIISICNYTTYQRVHRQPSQPNNNQATAEQQPNDKPATSQQQHYNKETNKHLSEDSSPDAAIATSDERVPSTLGRKVIPYSADFEAFWSAYPDRTNNSKVKAWESWRKLTPAERQQALASLPTFAAYCRANPTYRCVHAERYLRDRRFETQSAGQIVSNLAMSPESTWWRNANTVASITADRWRKAIDKHANGIWPVDKLGPPPGHELCVVPGDLVSELRLVELYDAAGNRRG